MYLSAAWCYESFPDRSKRHLEPLSWYIRIQFPNLSQLILGDADVSLQRRDAFSRTYNFESISAGTTIYCIADDALTGDFKLVNGNKKAIARLRNKVFRAPKLGVLRLWEGNRTFKGRDRDHWLNSTSNVGKLEPCDYGARWREYLIRGYFALLTWKGLIVVNSMEHIIRTTNCNNPRSKSWSIQKSAL